MIYTYISLSIMIKETLDLPQFPVRLCPGKFIVHWKCCKSKMHLNICNLPNMLPRWLSGKESACKCRRQGFNPWVRSIPWRRKWQSTPVFLPGKSHRTKNLVGYTPWGHKKKSDKTEELHTHNLPNICLANHLTQNIFYKKILKWCNLLNTVLKVKNTMVVGVESGVSM